MALRKRFLHPDPKFFVPSKRRFVMGSLIGILFAPLFYQLMCMTREVLRICTVTPEYDILTLTQSELHFLNFFLACLSWIFAQSLCVLIWFDGPLAKYGRLSRRVGAALNDNRVLNLSFLSWFSRLALLYPVFFCFNYALCEVGLLAYFKTGMILILIVVFLEPWLTVLRVFRRQAMEWMLCSAVLIATLSFGLSRLQPFYFATLDEMFLSRNIPHNYHVELPRVASGWHLGIRSFTNGKINIIAPKDSAAADPVIIMQGPFLSDNHWDSHRIPIDSVSSMIRTWNSEFFLTTRRFHYQLYINSDIPMELVNRIKTLLSQTEIPMVVYAVAPLHPKAGYWPPYYDNRTGISLRLSPAYKDTAMIKEGYRKSQIFSNILELYHVDDGYRLNTLALNTEDLQETLCFSIQQNPDYVIRYHIADRMPYGKYIETIAAIVDAVENIREEYISSRHGKAFGEREPEYWEAQEHYPLRILELTEDMERQLSEM